MALFSEQVPELGRIAFIGPTGISDLRRTSGEGLVGFGRRGTRHGETGQVTLHIGDERRDAG